MSIDSTEFLIGEWILLAVCFIVVFARLAVRTWNRIWSFWLSEIFLLIALLFYLALVIGDTYAASIGKSAFIDFYYDAGFAKWRFASSVVFDTGFYFPRFSLLAFYNELFPQSEKKLRIALKLVTAYTICAFLVTVFVDMFWCGADISSNWADDYSECALANSAEPMYINWSVSISSELLVFALPFGILKMKVLQPKDKKALLCIFLLGIGTVLTSAARFALTVQSIWDYSTYLVGSVEIATQIIVISLPALRPLLNALSRRWEKWSGTATRSGTQQQLKDTKQNTQVSGTIISFQSKNGAINDSSSNV